jgi:hypothetical protein
MSGVISPFHDTPSWREQGQPGLKFCPFPSDIIMCPFLKKIVKLGSSETLRHRRRFNAKTALLFDMYQLLIRHVRTIIYIYIYIYVYTCVCIYIYTYIHTEEAVIRDHILSTAL